MALHWSERLLPTVESNMTPALLTRMSMLPNSSTALRTRSWACCSSVTSHSTAIASPPSRDTLSTSSSRRSLRRAPATTVAPSVASARTVASPMPLEAPVTTATLPFNLSPTCITSLWVEELQRGSTALCRAVSVMYPNSRGTYQGPASRYLLRLLCGALLDGTVICASENGHLTYTLSPGGQVTYLRNARGVDQRCVVTSYFGGIAIHSSRVESQVEVREVYQRMLRSVRRMVVGKDRVVDLCLISLLAGGHVLLTDIPGVGKTKLARAISSSIAADFSRIQFTPDLLPSDITGTSIYDPGEARFGWIPGPVFAPILLADEINRATPRTQSALLEAMAEGQVTVEGATRPLPEPFFVVATQNPHQFHGTYPLPKGQLDRFMVATSMGYPGNHAERGIVRAQVERRPLEEVEPVVEIREILEARRLVKAVQVHDEVLAYAVAIAEATRNHPAVSLGASPRGSIALVRVAQARAATRARDFVGPEDVKEPAPEALAHRLTVRGGTTGTTAESALKEILDSVPPPV